MNEVVVSTDKMITTKLLEYHTNKVKVEMTPATSTKILLQIALLLSFTRAGNATTSYKSAVINVDGVHHHRSMSPLASCNHRQLLGFSLGFVNTLNTVSNRPVSKAASFCWRLSSISSGDNINKNELDSTTDVFSTGSSRSSHNPREINNVAIVGGGLAGLSVAYNLLDIISEKRNGGIAHTKGLRITLYDKANVGEGGASSVAGGLLHPFSPRGKLIHKGLLALQQSNHLIQMAMNHQPQCLIRPHLYRIALTDSNVKQLQDTATNHPELATWISKEEIYNTLGAETMGGLKLENGCQVIHVPLYLKGLWEECEEKAREINGSSITWTKIKLPMDENESKSLWNSPDYDAVILSAGAGILHDGLICTENDKHSLPVQLVRGQSIEMSLPEEPAASVAFANEAMLCGKYISPLASTADTSNCATSESTTSNLDENQTSVAYPTSQKNRPEHQRFVIGATHEFQSDALTPSEVMKELKSRSYPLAPQLWDNGIVDKLTMGFRVQSNRGKFGRMPIIGRYLKTGKEIGETNTSAARVAHPNSWIFTGLSSRGLMYHGLFGRWLADAVLHDDENKVREQFAEFDWWRQTKDDVVKKEKGTKKQKRVP